MKVSQGKEEPFYPLFADFAEQAVLIAGVMVAERLDQREDSGRLRLNARDLASKFQRCALFDQLCCVGCCQSLSVASTGYDS